MKFKELKEDAAERRNRIYLLEGDETYFTDRGAEIIKSAFCGESELDYSAFDGAQIKNGESVLISAVRAFPFLSQFRVVRVNEYYPTEREYARVSELFDNPSQTTALVIVNKTVGNGARLKEKPNVAYVDCSRASEEDCVKWIFYTLKKSGAAVSSDLCSRIVSYCSCNMARIALETEKLSEYFRAGGEINAESIDELVYKDADYKLYELTSAAARKNFNDFSLIMSDMLAKDYNEADFLSALGGYYKNLYDCAVCPLDDNAAGRLLNMKPYAVKKNREQVRRLGKDTARELFSYLFELSALVRSGRLTPESALYKTNAKIFFDG